MKRLHVTGKEKCAEEADMDSDCSRKRDEVEGNDKPESGTKDSGDAKCERIELKNEAFDEMNKMKLKVLPQHSADQKLSYDITQKDCATNADDVVKQNNPGSRTLFLATRSRHLLSDATREKLEQQNIVNNNHTCT